MTDELRLLHTKSNALPFDFAPFSKWYIRFNTDGTIELNPELSLDEAAKGFWECVTQTNPFAGLHDKLDAANQKISSLESDLQDASNGALRYRQQREDYKRQLEAATQTIEAMVTEIQSLQNQIKSWR